MTGGVVVDSLLGDARERDAGVDLEGTPGEEAGFDLVGEDVGIARSFVNLLRHCSGDLMMPVAVGDVADKGGGDDERACHADDADDVVEHAIVAPGLEGFVDGLGEAKVGDAGPVLVDSIVVAGGEELLGARGSELVPVVGGHDVLAAFAAVEGEERGVDTLAAALVGEHAAVFVVGVSNNHGEAGPGVELLQGLGESRRAAVDGKGTRKG